MTPQEYYAREGEFVVTSTDPLKLGPLEKNDWNEDDMCAHRWTVTGEATREEFLRQKKALGYTNTIDHRFRFFYRVVAMD